MGRIEEKHKKKRFSIWQIIFLTLTLMIGLVLVFNEPIKQQWVYHRTQTAVKKPLNPKTIKKEEKKYKASYDYKDVKPLSFQEVAKVKAQNPHVPTVGKIAIPSVNILLPIVPGVSNASLSTGAGTLHEHQTMGRGNFALASHNMNDYKTLFSPLLNIKKQAKMYLTNGSKVYEYTVVTKRYIAPTEISVIDNHNTAELTLITCSLDGKKRLLVQGPLTATYSYQSKENLFK